MSLTWTRRGGAVARIKGTVSELVGSIVVMGQSVSRGNDSAQSTPLHRAVRGWENADPRCSEREMATTPMLFIGDEGASGFDNLELEGFCHRGPPTVGRTYSSIQINQVQVPRCLAHGGVGEGPTMKEVLAAMAKGAVLCMEFSGRGQRTYWLEPKQTNAHPAAMSPNR